MANTGSLTTRFLHRCFTTVFSQGGDFKFYIHSTLQYISWVNMRITLQTSPFEIRCFKNSNGLSAGGCDKMWWKETQVPLWSWDIIPGHMLLYMYNNMLFYMLLQLLILVEGQNSSHWIDQFSHKNIITYLSWTFR